jgi:hypothetical protein
MTLADRRMPTMQRAVLALALGAGLLSSPALAADATLHRTPSCGCCLGYADALKQVGFAVTVVDADDLDAFKAEHAVPEDLAGCHTTLIDGYVIEGHVPLAIVERLLRERPAIRGVSLPGMPMGSPGMGGAKSEPFVVYQIGDGEPVVYATE